ncbi:MAG: alginate lyase family protein, partial [Armatimonadetes bacterium]|nr:alginate lyase family protein [Armatimonadota bacterium]
MNKKAFQFAKLLLIFAFLAASCRPGPGPTALPTAATTPAGEPTQAGTPSVGVLPTEPAPTQVTPSVRATVSGNSRGYLTTPQELQAIKQKAEQGIEPYRSTVQAALLAAQEALNAKFPRVPDEIDIDEDKIETPKYLSEGALDAYALALGFHLVKESDPLLAEKYAEKAYKLVMTLPRRHTDVSGYQANTRLNLSVYIPAFVYAADLLADWKVPGTDKFFYESPDNQQLKEWLGSVIIRYPYNAAHTRNNNWGAWARLATAAIGDYVGADAPLYIQGFAKGISGEYLINPLAVCDPHAVVDCLAIDGGMAYATALRLHFEFVDGKLVENSRSSCDSEGIPGMIRPDGGLPDELRRQYKCDSIEIKDPEGAAASYSQFAIQPMVSLAEIAWRRGSAELYTHIDPATGRGALYRAIQFLVKNNVRMKHPT